MKRVLEELGGVAGVIGSLVVDHDGITIAENIESDAEQAAAACVEIVDDIRDALAKIEKEELVQALIETAEGKVFLREIESVGTLVVLSERAANIGMVRLEMARAGEKIRAIRKSI